MSHCSLRSPHTQHLSAHRPDQSRKAAPPDLPSSDLSAKANRPPTVLPLRLHGDFEHLQVDARCAGKPPPQPTATSACSLGRGCDPASSLGCWIAAIGPRSSTRPSRQAPAPKVSRFSTVVERRPWASDSVQRPTRVKL